MFKEVQAGNVIDIKTHKDDVYEGVYVGFKGITTKIGQQFIYRFRDPKKGNLYGIYGFTTLNMAMENVVVGSLCRVTYLGTKNMETKFGKKDVHICKVEVDDEFTLSPTDESDSEHEPF